MSKLWKVNVLEYRDVNSPGLGALGRVTAEVGGGLAWTYGQGVKLVGELGYEALKAGTKVVDRAGSAVALTPPAPLALTVLPQTFALFAAHPNPFNPETAIDFTIPADVGTVRLEIFDMLGQRIAVLYDGELAPGAHRMHWRGLDQQSRPVASGIYIYRLQSERRVLAKRMVLVR